MISPFLKTSIYGAIWYQGEQNAYQPDGYNCTFPAMINGWRKDWSNGTGGQTDPKFPFGFVQVCFSPYALLFFYLFNFICINM